MKANKHNFLNPVGKYSYVGKDTLEVLSLIIG